MDNRNKAIICMLLKCFFLTLMVTSVKFAKDYTLYHQMFFKALIGIFFISLVIKKKGYSFRANNKKLMFLRCFLGLTGSLCYFNAIRYIDVSIAVTITNTMPFFVLILAFLLLGEDMTKGKILSLIIAIIGIIIIVRPSGGGDFFHIMQGIFGVFLTSIVCIMLRELRKTEEPEVIVFYFFLITLIFATPYVAIHKIKIISAFQFTNLVLIGVFSVIEQIFMTFAFKYGEASDVSIYSYGNIVFALIFGYLFFKEKISLVSMIGIILIVVAGLINYFLDKGKKIEQNDLEEF